MKALSRLKKRSTSLGKQAKPTQCCVLRIAEIEGERLNGYAESPKGAKVVVKEVKALDSCGNGE